MRHFTPVDQIIISLERILKSTSYNPTMVVQKEVMLTKEEQKKSAALMRVNHTGEVCAQALYLGQALVARNDNLVNQLYIAASEEEEHLQWCKTRVQALNSRTSRLNPLFAVGSFGIGIIAGLAGDKLSLGFLAETEHQVTKHIENHLEKIPTNDLESRRILEKMREDELKHATKALEEGGVLPSKPIRILMKLTSKIMTLTTKYF